MFTLFGQRIVDTEKPFIVFSNLDGLVESKICLGDFIFRRYYSDRNIWLKYKQGQCWRELRVRLKCNFKHIQLCAKRRILTTNFCVHLNPNFRESGLLQQQPQKLYYGKSKLHANKITIMDGQTPNIEQLRLKKL